MSLFRKPKKIQRRVFSSAIDDDEDAAIGNGKSANIGENLAVDKNVLLTIPPPPSPPAITFERKEKSKDNKRNGKTALDGNESKNSKSKALLSFADDEDETEIFQVRKSSHSKKVMRMLDKERRKKKREERDGTIQLNSTTMASTISDVGANSYSDSIDNAAASRATAMAAATATSKSTSSYSGNTNFEQCNSKKSDSIQTEIRTDDFVLVVKKTESELILNGRAALCAGRDDMSDEDEDNAESENDQSSHRFSKPEQLKLMLESGSIPDAAMIHAARKRRQKAREQGDFISIEEPKEAPKKGSRLAREDVEGDNSDDEERVDMNAITGVKEREERREQFYSVENDYSEGDSDRETHEWENQQIRKGVTGAQLMNAQHETVLSRFMIKSTSNPLECQQQPQSTSTLLEQAYAKSSLEKPQQVLASTKVKKDKLKAACLRTPQEIREAISNRLTKLQELHCKHVEDIEKMSADLKLLQLEEADCNKRAPTAAAKYRFYQEVKCYIDDLIDCLNEKNPLITDLEKRIMQTYSKRNNFLIERRRQDVRDQAKEMAEAAKPATARRGPEYEQQQRRAAEREGRRTRRRCERERNEQLAIHLDGMSSDDETSDRHQEQFENGIEQLIKESEEIFSDTNDDFYKVEEILMKFYAWRKTDLESYKDAFVSLCLPKILGPLVRLEMLNWFPLHEEYQEIENMNWHSACMLYAFDEHETDEMLKNDPDVHLVPNVIMKIVLPKMTEIVNNCWDPLSTRQTLRLIGCINRLARDYPLKATNKTLKQLFDAILGKMKLALESDVFIPIFPKQVQEAKTSFFQRQFCSGLKLFRNFLSWQGILADRPLREMAIGCLLNRYLLLAMRVCSANDAISKAYIVVNTLPTVWLQPGSETLKNLQPFIAYIKQTLDSCDSKNPLQMQSCDKAKQVLQRLHSF